MNLYLYYVLYNIQWGYYCQAIKAFSLNYIMGKKIAILVILLIVGITIFNLGKQISDSITASKRIDQAADEVSELQNENKRLNKRLSEVQEFDFIEETARNKLNMARPGETIVIVSQDELGKVLNSEKKTEPPKLANWQGWLKLFLDWGRIHPRGRAVVSSSGS